MKLIDLALFVVINAAFVYQLYPTVYGERVVANTLNQTVMVQARTSEDSGFIGSGVVISDRGHILTAAHLIGDEVKEYKVKFFNGSTDTVHVVGFNRESDLALLRLDRPDKLVGVATVATRQVIRGEGVIIVGYPHGLEFTVTRGIVSGLNRLHIYNQSDAVANPGNSGGPVFDNRGHVIGILSAGMPEHFYTGQSLFIKLELINKFLEEYSL
jgi:S1-C subfamily serine protease